MKKLIDCLQIGNKVFDVHRGWGIVQHIYIEADYSISVYFKDHNSNADYTSDGKLHNLEINPSLFLHEVKLEQNLPEFVEGEIVLACEDYEETNWFVAKYNSKDFDNEGHLVYYTKFGGFENKPMFVEQVKSFDKSYFVK